MYQKSRKKVHHFIIMPSPVKKNRVIKEINGAVGSPATATLPVAQTAGNVPSKHQTDGMYVPITGPITNVRQLTRGNRNVAKGSIESFGSLTDYTAYLRHLTSAELNRHAVEEARVVPIDDKDRLIRRLENNWTEVAARERSRMGENVLPPRPGFTDEQKAAQEAIRRRMLGGRA